VLRRCRLAVVHCCRQAGMHVLGTPGWNWPSYRAPFQTHTASTLAAASPCNFGVWPPFATPGRIKAVPCFAMAMRTSCTSLPGNSPGTVPRLALDRLPPLLVTPRTHDLREPEPPVRSVLCSVSVPKWIFWSVPKWIFGLRFKFLFQYGLSVSLVRPQSRCRNLVV
jgi:hypothetical protein